MFLEDFRILLFCLPIYDNVKCEIWKPFRDMCYFLILNQKCATLFYQFYSGGNICLPLPSIIFSYSLTFQLTYLFFFLDNYVFAHLRGTLWSALDSFPKKHKHISMRTFFSYICKTVPSILNYRMPSQYLFILELFFIDNLSYCIW